MDDFSRPWRSLSPLIVLTSWSSIPRLAVFISDFRNHSQLCLTVLMGSLTTTGLLSTASSWPAIFPHPSKHREGILYILNLLSISHPKCALMLQEGRHGSIPLGFLETDSHHAQLRGLFVRIFLQQTPTKGLLWPLA